MTCGSKFLSVCIFLYHNKTPNTASKYWNNTYSSVQVQSGELSLDPLTNDDSIHREEDFSSIAWYDHIMPNIVVQ